MESVELLSTRLENLAAITPMLSALRLVALGGWQAAQKRRRHLERVTGALAAMTVTGSRPAAGGRVYLLAVGTERGLVGRFCENVAGRLAALPAGEQRPHLHVLGSRLRRLLEKRGVIVDDFDPLSGGRLPAYGLARRLADRWWEIHRAGELSRAMVIYNERSGFRPAVVRQVIALPAGDAAGSARPVPWPPPIVETDAEQLAEAVDRLRLRTAIYRLLLTSAEAEHVTRFQLLEAAVQNAERLVEELTTRLRSARQQAITREMQELVAGAGLLGGQVGG